MRTANDDGLEVTILAGLQCLLKGHPRRRIDHSNSVLQQAFAIARGVVGIELLVAVCCMWGNGNVKVFLCCRDAKCKGILLPPAERRRNSDIGNSGTAASPRLGECDRGLAENTGCDCCHAHLS